jgi:hypothetical protein
MKLKLLLRLALVLGGALLGFSTSASTNLNTITPRVAAVAKVEIKVAKVDSEETNSQDGYGQNAVDGNLKTYWHTQWHGNSPGLPHEIIIELIPPSVIKGFTYLPRQDESDHGTIKDYEFYISDDGMQFGQPVKKGTFEPGKEEKIETFEPVKCRFIKLKAISEINGLPWTSAAEICVIQSGEDASVMANKINQAANLLKEFERTKSFDQLKGAYMAVATLPDLGVDKTVPKTVARQERAKLWFSLLAVIGQNIDTNDYGPIFLNLIPPPTPEGVRYFSGVDPNVIKDPETRSNYEAAIQENNKKKVRAVFQTQLHNLDQIANIEAERFVRAYYTTSKEDQSELENLMKQAKLSPVQAQKLKALTIRQ